MSKTKPFNLGIGQIVTDIMFHNDPDHTIS